MADDLPKTEPPSPPPAAGPSHNAPTHPPSAGHTAGGGGLPSKLPARFGRYELLELLGKGGMGAVYLATDTNLGRRVALKVPHLAGADPDSARILHDRFLREARLAASLSHPNLCPVHDCGEVDGVLYMAMTYLEGKPLSKFIYSGQHLPPRAVVAVVRQLALAMQQAHSHGVIHRDLKPSNIMITPSKQPVIMDFGLARRTDAEDTKLTRSGLVVGTPAYMPPEQLNGDQALIGPGTDVYALGVILYELLAGRPPFVGPLGVLMAQIMIDPPPPLGRWRTELAPALDGICGRALAKLPRDRYPSMQAFAAALDEYLRTPPRAAAVAPTAASAPHPVLRPPAGPPAPLDEENAATLFNEMAAQQVRLGNTPRSQHVPRRRPRRRQRRLPEWLIPAAASLATVAVMGVVIAFVVTKLPRRAGQGSAQASNLVTPTTVMAGDGVQQLTVERLRAALDRLAKDPAADSARREIDDWAAGSSSFDGLDPQLTVALGKYLVLRSRRPQSERRGLQLLAGWGEPLWREAAELDLPHGTRAPAAVCLKCGDAWWRLAETANDWTREPLYDRAKMWYAAVDFNHTDQDDLSTRDLARARQRARSR